jgi:hypothetical protein
MANPPLDPELPEAYYTGIGRVAAAWANMEADLDDAIAELTMGERSLSQILTAQMRNIGNKTATFRSLVSERDAPKDLIKEASSWAEDIKALAAYRAEVIHGNWWISSLDGSIRLRVTRANAELKIDHMPETPDALNDLAGNIRSMHLDLSALMTKMRASLPPWRPKYGKPSDRTFPGVARRFPRPTLE